MRRWILIVLSFAGALTAEGQIQDVSDDLPRRPQADPLADERAAEVEGEAPVNPGRLQVTYVGNTAFNREELAKGIEQQYRMVEEFGLDQAVAYDVAYFLEVYYRKHGYSRVQVTPTVTGPLQLRLAIVEGPLTRLGSVSIVGFQSYEFSYLQNFLLGPLRERFPRIQIDRELPFVESDIEEGVNLIRRLYTAEGFLDAEVTLEPPNFNNGFQVANITVEIKEGIRYTWGDIDFAGAKGPYTNETLRAMISEELSDPFTPTRVMAAGRVIEDHYRTNGYYKAAVNGEYDVEAARNGVVDVSFRIESGALFRFDGVRVTGDEHVPDDFVANRLRSLRGQVYNPELINDKFRTLLDTGLFTNIRINPVPINGDELLLDVTVEPAKTKSFGIGLGYGTFVGGIVSLSYSDRNVFGTGRPFTSSIEATQRGINGEVTYTDPWLFETENSLKLRLYAQNIVLEGYSKNEFGFRPSLTRNLTKHWDAGIFILAKYVNIYDVLIEPESLVGATDYSVGSIGITTSLDYRDNPVLPTRGFYGTASADFSPEGVGETSFVRGFLQAVYYLPVTRRSTLAFGARGGVISPLNDDQLPIDERYFNGGATTVRSFPELKLGPKDRAGYPLGGEAFTVFNVEYNFPIWDQLIGAVFFDAGNVIPEAADFGTEDMRYAIGGGLRYNLPVGPIRFDYGWNPNQQQGEPEGAFHFSIGVAF